jgi:hypothetical protein
MLSQEEISGKIFEEVLKIHEELGEEYAYAFLAGIKFAVSLQSEMILNLSANSSISEYVITLGQFYSDISKGEIS